MATDTKKRNKHKNQAGHKNGRAIELDKKAYEKELHDLQVELCRLQDWVKETGERIIILFEGAMPRARAGRSRP